MAKLECWEGVTEYQGQRLSPLSRLDNCNSRLGCWGCGLSGFKQKTGKAIIRLAGCTTESEFRQLPK